MKIELRMCSNGYYYVYFENEIIDYIEFDKFNYIDAKELVDLANQFSIIENCIMGIMFPKETMIYNMINQLL